MGFSMELVKARRRIKELEADITDLLEQLAISRGEGKDIPSPADIVQQSGQRYGEVPESETKYYLR